MTTCKCGVRIARGRYLRWVHTERPNPLYGPHYALPAPHVAEATPTPRSTSATSVAGRVRTRTAAE